MHTHIGLADGGFLDFARPFEEATYTLKDLAIGASRICRYNGAVPWTLGQHLLLCGKLCRVEPARAHGVFHDAHEPICMDVPSPLKPFLGDAYREIEERAMVDVHRRFGLTWPIPSEVETEIHRCDKLAWRLEVAMHGSPVHRAAAGETRFDQAEMLALADVAGYPPKEVAILLHMTFLDVIGRGT